MSDVALRRVPSPIRRTDPCNYDYGHHTGVILNVWWPLAEVNNQPRVVTRNTDVLASVSSEWRDLNPRPPAPKAGALPSCATFRVSGLLFEPQITSANVIGPKSKPDAVSRWKGDFQRFRYLSAVLYFLSCPVRRSAERGYVGMLSSRRQITHKRLMAQMSTFGCYPVRDPRSRCPAHPLDQSGRS